MEDARLGVQPVLRELFPVIVLGLLALSEHFGLGAEAVRLLIVHLGDEFLFALQLLYALIGSLLLHAQFDNSVLQLMLLVLLLLRQHNCVHHDIVRFGGRRCTHSRGQILVLLLEILG